VEEHRRRQLRTQSRGAHRRRAADAHDAVVGREALTRPLRWRTAVVVTAVAFLAACTSSRTPTHAGTTPDSTTPAGSSTSRTPAPSSVGGVHTVTDAANGSTVSLHVGDELRVVLRSTYWDFGPLPAGGVLTLAAQPTLSVDPSCVPGGGCGSQSAVYRAGQPGRVVLTASRTSCGEALACSPAASRFSLTVVVE